MRVLMRVVVACTLTATMASHVSANAAPGNEFYGSVQARSYEDSGDDSAPTPAMEFSINQQSDDSFNATTSSTPPASGSGSSVPQMTAAPPATSPPPPNAPVSRPPRGDRSCQWEGYTLRHHSAKYFVGRAHRRGSIFGECIDSKLMCYEDPGIADAQASQYQQIACDHNAIFVRQRDLDLEDQTEEARSRLTSAAP